MHPQEPEWLTAYLFFAGEVHGETGDRVLREVVAPLVESCRTDVIRWFFLRYYEDGAHLRLRFLAPTDTLEEVVWPRIQTATSSDLVTRLLRTTYEGEVKRYGGPSALALAEELFHHSSDAALALLAKVEPGNQPARLGKALLATLVLIYLYTRTTARAARFAELYGTNYLSTWALDAKQQKSWHASFQQSFDRQSDQLADYVEAAWEALEAGEELTSELDIYRRAMEEFAQRLRTLQEQQQVYLGSRVATNWSSCVQHILPSYIHMMNNRLGVSIQEESYLAVLISKTFQLVETES